MGRRREVKVFLVNVLMALILHLFWENNYFWQTNKT